MRPLAIITLLLSLSPLGAACGRAAQPRGGSPAAEATSQATAASPPGAAPHDGPSAPAADCAGARVFGAHARAPQLASGQGQLVVGWEEEGPGGSRLLISSLERAERCLPPVELTEAGEGLSVALTGGVTCALWRAPGEGGGIRAGVVDWEAGAVTARPLSSPGLEVSAPALRASGEGFVAAWIAGDEVRAVKLDRSGEVVASASWHGGGRFTFGGRGRVVERRAKGARGRPRLVSGAAGLELIWHGERWFSDDMVGPGTYRAPIVWGAEAQEPQLLELRFETWGALGALDTDPSGRPLLVEERHNPNGGPWELWIGGDDPAERQRVTSEAAGPLRPSLLADRGGSWVIWRSADAHALTARRARAGTAPALGPPSYIPITGAPIEVDYAAAPGSDGRLWVALADVQGDERCVRVRSLDPDEPSPRPSPPPARPTGAPVEAAGERAPSYLATASLEDGRSLVVWLDYWESRVAGLWLDPSGEPAGPLVRFPSLARCGHPSVATAGETFLVTYHCYRDATSNDSPRIEWVAARWGDAKPKGRELISDGRHYSPHIIVRRPSGSPSKGLEAALVMTEGWDPRQVVMRRAAGASPAELGRALSRAPERRLLGDAVATGLAWLGGAPLILGHRTRQEGAHAKSELWLVSAEGIGSTRALDDGPHPLWAAHRMAVDQAGLAVIAFSPRLDGGDVVLLRYSERLDPVGSTVLARNSGLAWPCLSVHPERGSLAAAWYDPASDGDYAALVAPSGHRLEPPRRLDDPAIRASSGHPAALPVSDGWRWLWTDPQRLWMTPR